MQKKSLRYLVVCLLMILIIIGGYTYMQNKVVSVPKFPTQPITIIVPFSAGGSLDLMARTLEKVALKHLGQPLVVVNKVGGAGAIGWNELASATPDGYTIGITAPEVLTLPLYGPTKYHYPTALEPLAQIASAQMIIVVHSDLPYKNIEELITYSKEHPGQLKFGHAGIGSLPHIFGETFAKSANINLEQVPFRGSSEVATALLGKHIEIAILSPTTVKEHIKNGTLRALAISGEHRLSDPDLAQIPTFKEQGIDVEFTGWYGIAVPKGLPPEIKAQLTACLKDMISDPEFTANLNNLGMEVEYLDGKASANKWITEREKSTKILQETGILDLVKSQKK